MKQIVVMSGKGGTGKTFVSSSLACTVEQAVFADCDVDAANLHLMLRPDNLERHSYESGVAARIDQDKCTGCGICVERCRFGAVSLTEAPPSPTPESAGVGRATTGPGVKVAKVDHVSCEGCGVCALVCPAGAVSLDTQTRGEWYRSATPYGPLVHARLSPGEENSGKLVEQVRRAALEEATRLGARWIVIDGPPGTGCAAKSAMTGADYVLIVTEPTVSGAHDLARVADLADQFQIPMGILVNKADLSPSQTEAFRRLARDRGVDYLGEIPFSREVARSLTSLQPYPCGHGDEISWTISAVWFMVTHRETDRSA